MTAMEQAAVGGFVTVASASEIAPGTVRVVEVDGRSLCVGFTEDGEWGAIDNVCTHDGGVLGEGELDENAVECPRHGGRFDLFSGNFRTHLVGLKFLQPRNHHFRQMALLVTVRDLYCFIAAYGGAARRLTQSELVQHGGE